MDSSNSMKLKYAVK